MIKIYKPLEDRDPLQEHAAHYCRREANPTTARLAAELGINYGRAANIMQELVRARVVSEIGADGKRQVLA